MNLENYKVEFLLETVNIKELSDAEYFSSDYSHYVSNSKLKLINPDEGGNPKLFHEGIKSEYNSSFEFGTAVHQLLLQPESFRLSDYPFKPSAKLGLFVDNFIKYRQKGLSIYDSMLKSSDKSDYYKGKLSNKKIKNAIEKGLRYYLDVTQTDLLLDEYGREVLVLSEKLKNDVADSIKSANNNLKIQNLLTNQNFEESIKYFNEQAMFIDISITLPNKKVIIIPFKLKFDNYSIDPDNKIVTLNDLKTTGKPVSYFMGNLIPVLDEKGKKINDQWINGSFQKLHYYRQMAIYMIILQAYCKTILNLENYQYKANMLVIESIPQFKSDVFQVSQSYIKQGLIEFKELICRVAWHEYYGYDVELNENE